MTQRDARRAAHDAKAALNSRLGPLRPLKIGKRNFDPGVMGRFFASLGLPSGQYGIRLSALPGGPLRHVEVVEVRTRAVVWRSIDHPGVELPPELWR